MRPALLLPLLAAVRGQAGPDPSEVLERARANLQTMTQRLSRYACIETVYRRYYVAPSQAKAPVVPRAAPLSCAQIKVARDALGPRLESGLQLQSTDRLRLEVTVSEGHEIHAWPGATRFDTRDVDEIIHEGPIGTGTYGTHLIGVFDHNPGVEFQFAGEKTEGGRKLVEYQYKVPLAASRYRVKTGASWQTIPYGGTFQLDAGSLELQRFTVKAEELPAASTMCQVQGDMDYSQVRIGDGDILLPRQGQLQIVMADGKETRNITTFADCREYQAESELLFDANPEVSGAAAKPVVRTAVALPIGLPIMLALIAPIDTDTAAAGDPVSAEVTKPVRRAGSNDVLIPAGAMVRGRITRLERHLFPEPYFLIALSFNRLAQGDVSSPFAAKYDSNKGLAQELGATLRSRSRGLEYWDVGTFLFPTVKPRYVIPAGYESKWETLATPSR